MIMGEKSPDYSTSANEKTDTKILLDGESIIKIVWRLGKKRTT
jgi:hypothetical protein